MSKTILIVDAEPVVRSVVSAILQSGGYSVLESNTVEGGMEILKNSAVDLLLTNVYLPGITGAEAMSLFKKAYPDLRVLMVSGLPDDEVIRTWAGNHHFQVFPKPFTASGLLRKVRSVLNDEVQTAVEQSEGA